MARIKLSREEPPTSLRSSVVVAGSTMSAWRAVGVHQLSLHDDGLRLLPGALQPVEVLVVMERIAAGPIDQLDVGIGVAAAVELVARAGIEQHVGDAGDRDHGARRIERQRDTSGAASLVRGAPTPPEEPWPKAKPPPGSPMPPSIAASVIAAQ